MTHRIHFDAALAALVHAWKSVQTKSTFPRRARDSVPHHPAINPKPEPSSANDDEFAEVGRLGDVGGDDAELASA